MTTNTEKRFLNKHLRPPDHNVDGVGWQISHIECSVKDFKAFILSEKQAWVDEMVKIISKYFYSLQSRIPLPDPITMQDEIISLLKEKGGNNDTR